MLTFDSFITIMLRYKKLFCQAFQSDTMRIINAISGTPSMSKEEVDILREKTEFATWNHR
jgi:hypothetical protein